jgi:probable H4MPT-linked C1 transfer pathway protein
MPQTIEDRRVDLLAFDIGGANIKAADGRGWTHDEPFAMWRECGRLPAALERIVQATEPQRIVATMTGEIADCFPDRATGVATIVDAVEAAACGAPLGIYLVDGGIVTAAEARSRPLDAAASNWHAVARLAAAIVPDARGVLVDIGSTTADIIPFERGRPIPTARDDAGRLRSGELVYTGIERTPVAVVVRTLSHAGMRRPVVAERFAESRDAWLLLGVRPEDPTATDTADGGPATRDAARRRLARCLLLDEHLFTAADAVAAATRIADAQARQIARSLRRVIHRCGSTPERVVVSGHGGPLARKALGQVGWDGPIEDLEERLGAGVARSAPAHALALIARGELP